MRSLLLVTGLAFLLCFDSSVEAAIVQKVNDEKDKVIVELSSAELASLEESQEVIVEVQSPRFVTSGVLKKMNIIKKTVIIVLNQPDARFAKRQKVSFLSLFHNAVYSGQISNFGQYYQYNHSNAAGQFGGIYQQSTFARGDDKGKNTLTGYKFGADAYLLVDPQWFGAGIGFQNRNYSSNTTYESADPAVVVGDAEKETYSITHLKPAVWVELQKNWRFGIQFDYLMIDYKFDAVDLNHHWDLFVPTISTVRYGHYSELGGYYRDRAKYESVTTVNQGPGISAESKLTIKTPAELGFFYRSAASPTFIWGVDLGWVFYERELTDDQPLRRKAEPMETTKFNLSFEHRLESGSKFEWALTYAGAQAPSPVIIWEQNTNQVGLDFGYHRFLSESILIGGRFGLVGGSRVTAEEADEQGNIVTEEEKYSTLGTHISLFIQKDLEFIDERGPSR